MKKRDLIITIAFFLIILVIPGGTLIRNIAGIKPEADTEEQRRILEFNGTLENKEAEDNTPKQEEFALPSTKVDFSEMNLNLIDKWVIAFTDFQYYFEYFCDDMFLDDTFIKANCNMSYALSGGHYIESNKVLIGNNDYLFYKDVTDGDPIGDYRGINMFDDENIIHLTTDLMLLNEEVKKRGATLYVLIYPNKEQIYSQYMPDTIYRNSLYSPGQQVYDFVSQNTDINIIYPYDALLKASENYPVYYKSDTHATRLGAFITFQEFMKLRYNTCEEIEDIDVSVKLENYSGDLAVLSKVKDTKGRDTVYDISGGNPDMWKDETILFVGDSFTGYLTNAAEMYYPRVHRVDSIVFNLSYIDKLKPDIVIYEAGERRVEYFETEDLYLKGSEK